MAYYDPHTTLNILYIYKFNCYTIPMEKEILQPYFTGVEVKNRGVKSFTQTCTSLKVWEQHSNWGPSVWLVIIV